LPFVLHLLFFNQAAAAWQFPGSTAGDICRAVHGSGSAGVAVPALRIDYRMERYKRRNGLESIGVPPEMGK